jgi:transketolase
MSASSVTDPREAFGAAVTEAADRDDRIMVLSADSGKSSGFSDFRVRHPERYVEVGIAEHCATGVAAGLATTGRIPVFCAIAAFVTCRNFEAFRNDVGYMKQNVKIVGRNGGFTYSDLGPTHHSLEDYAIVGAIPGVVVLSPVDPGQIADAAEAMLAWDGPVYMRIGAFPQANIVPRGQFRIGEAQHLREGSDVTVVSTGYITGEVVSAVDRLRLRGVDVDLLAMPTVIPLDERAILESARRTGHVITVEEHYVDGGLGSRVAAVLASAGVGRLDRIGVPHVHVPSGEYAGLLADFGLDAASLVSAISELIAG